MNTYEGLYIFPDSLKEEQLEKAIESAQSEIAKLGGHVQEVTRLGRKVFTRPMRKGKQEAGQYVVLIFELDGRQLQALHARYNLMEEVTRVQFIRQEKPAESAAATAAAEKEE